MWASFIYEQTSMSVFHTNKAVKSTQNSLPTDSIALGSD